MKVAIQGIKGSYHHQAAKIYFGQEIKLLECVNFKEIPEAIKNNSVDYGLMAIENSIAGSLLQNYRLLGQNNQEIIGEIYIQIEHCLMALEDESIESIKKVKSHPMALLQCENFFEDYPEIKLIESNDTADSAKVIAEKKSKKTAAIASEIAAEIYDLKILKKGIQTMKNNYTRFFVIANKNKIEQNKQANKASIKMTLGHQTGSLSQVLSILSIHGLNLTKIQSIPIMDKPWQYSFYVDLIFPSLATFNSVIEVLQHQTEEVEVLGIYKECQLQIMQA